MDIWHTCEPNIVGTEGWLGRALREFDPRKENVVTGVSFGPSMFRAMSLPGVPVACVSGSLETYGMLPGIQGEQRAEGVGALQECVCLVCRPGAGDGLPRHHRH